MLKSYLYNNECFSDIKLQVLKSALCFADPRAHYRPLLLVFVLRLGK